MMEQVLIVGAGGFLGAISRFGISKWIFAQFPHQFPWATLIVNVVGSFLIGIIAEYFREIEVNWTFFFLITGFLGSFTTFSAFSLESINLLKTNIPWFFYNVVSNLLLCLSFTALGIFICSLFRNLKT